MLREDNNPAGRVMQKRHAPAGRMLLGVIQIPATERHPQPPSLAFVSFERRRRPRAGTASTLHDHGVPLLCASSCVD